MKIVASLATHPSRYPMFAQTVATLLPQVDTLIICVNPTDDGGGGHLDAGMVLNAIRRERATKADEERMYIYAPPEDLGDSGKFYAMTAENARDWGLRHGSPAKDMFLICDDDNLYPPSFARDMREALHRYDWKAVVGLHGKVMRPPILSYHTGVVGISTPVWCSMPYAGNERQRRMRNECISMLPRRTWEIAASSMR